MAIYTNELDQVFRALSDSTRRSMLERLSEGAMNITALSEPYDISQPSISKHIGVLERAGLINRTKQGRESIIRINPAPAAHARDWIDYYMQFWNQQFDAVDDYLKQQKDNDES